jgi:hypothetical protein
LFSIFETSWKSNDGRGRAEWNILGHKVFLGCLIDQGVRLWDDAHHLPTYRPFMPQL